MAVHWDVETSNLDAQLVSDINTLLGDSPYSWAVYYGLRSCVEQAKLYAQGRTAPGSVVTESPPGESAHEFGLAVDVALLVMGKETWTYTEPGWAWLWKAVESHPRLHSGHDFPPGFTDNDHIESLKWQAKRGELHESGQWGHEKCADSNGSATVSV